MQQIEKTKRIAGGAATGAGMNFQASVLALAYVYMARGQRLCWLDRLVDDVPTVVDAETGGPGDDVRLTLKSGETVEVQVKKGLQSGSKLWDSLISLAKAINNKTIDYGVLIVCSQSSKTIIDDLAKDIIRFGEERTDNISRIGMRFFQKLEEAGLSAVDCCSRMRVHKISAQDSSQEAINVARAELAHICEHQSEVSVAWSTLFKDASVLIESRGRRDASTILRVLDVNGIKLKHSSMTAPLLLLDQITTWMFKSNEYFSIFGLKKTLRIDKAWIPLIAVVQDSIEESTSLIDEIKRYQSWGELTVSNNVTVDPETIGRFIAKTVIVGGPGMGKSTLLKRIARRYSEERIPVLQVRLAAVAARMKTGCGFEEAVFELGLDGCNVNSDEVRKASFPNWVLLCDGLDECGRLQEDVATGISRFAAGYPNSRILVTTRPIGYDSVYFSDWRHYDLIPYSESSVITHLAALVRECAPETSHLQIDTENLCKAELKNSKVGQIIARSPLLLALSASVFVRGGHLGKTKESLFKQIFEQIDQTPNLRIPEPPETQAILKYFLDLLGWHKTEQPVNSIKNTLDCCAKVLMSELNIPLLQAQINVESYLIYWQNVGIIEKIGYGGDETLVFIHKQFGEFAAARYLCTMPEDEQYERVSCLMEDPNWDEVFRFAGFLGLGNTIGTVILEAPSIKIDQTKRINKVLQIIAEANPPPTAYLRNKTFEEVFNIISSNRRLEALEIGDAISTVAARFPDEVCPLMSGLLEHQQSWTRLIAWASVIQSNNACYSLEDLADYIETGKDVVVLNQSFSFNEGRYDPSTHLEREIFERFVLKAMPVLLEGFSSEHSEVVIKEVFNHPHVFTIGAIQKAQDILLEKKRNYTVGNLHEGFEIPAFREDYLDTWRIVYEAIFDALDLEISHTDTTQSESLLHFSAFIATSGILHTEVSDFWSWQHSFDKPSTRETLKCFIDASGIDINMLREDARKARQYLNNKPGHAYSLIIDLIVDVDPPVIDWNAVRRRKSNFDLETIEKALYHPSHWMISLAFLLLSELSSVDEIKAVVQRVFKNGKNYSLWAACNLAKKLNPEETVNLLIDRLMEPLTYGCEYLFALLQRHDCPWNEKSKAIICSGLKSNVNIAEEAANLANKFSYNCNEELIPIIQDAINYWLKHEEPYPVESGVIPKSPRAKLVDALMKIRDPDYAELRAYILDTRTDVCQVGIKKLIQWFNHADNSCMQFLIEIANGSLSSHLLDKVLREKITLSPEEIRFVEGLLINEVALVRYNAMSILDNFYIHSERIISHAKILVGDDDLQIQDRANKILTSASEYYPYQNH